MSDIENFSCLEVSRKSVGRWQMLFNLNTSVMKKIILVSVLAFFLFYPSFSQQEETHVRIVSPGSHSSDVFYSQDSLSQAAPQTILLSRICNACPCSLIGASDGARGFQGGSSTCTHYQLIITLSTIKNHLKQHSLLLNIIKLSCYLW